MLSPIRNDPGVYVNDLDNKHLTIVPHQTVVAFIGQFAKGPLNKAVRVQSSSDFSDTFGGLDATYAASYAVDQFLSISGGPAVLVRVPESTPKAILGSQSEQTGLYTLEADPDGFDLLALPDVAALSASEAADVYREAALYCEASLAFLLCDLPLTTTTVDGALQWMKDTAPQSSHGAVYFPALSIPDPLDNARPRTVAPSGTLAGIIVASERKYGVWKAPAGPSASLHHATPGRGLTDAENGTLNEAGVNALRTFPTVGAVVWGARTLRGSDLLNDQYPYIAVRRLALFIEKSLTRGLQWVAFEQNNAATWVAVTNAARGFMSALYQQGAFVGASPSEAYKVVCDATTTTPDDIQQGLLNVVVKFAPVYPAEFIVLYLSQQTSD